MRKHPFSYVLTLFLGLLSLNCSSQQGTSTAPVIEQPAPQFDPNGYEKLSGLPTEERTWERKVSVPANGGNIIITPGDKAVPVKAEVVGFSTVSAFNRNPETNTNIYNDPEGIRLVKETGGKTLRFPGGTFSMKFRPYEAKYDKLIDSHIKLSKSTGITKTILVLNLFAGTIEEAKYTIDKLQKGGVEIVAVELGNEYHLKKYRKKYPKPEAVIEEFKRYIDVLEPLLPGVNFGIPVCSSRHVFDSEQFGSRADFFENWNAKLGAAIKSGELRVQAVIPHFYKQTYEVYDLPTKQKRFDGVMDLMRVDSYDFLDKAVLRYYQSVFGDVDFWITEWGVKEKQVYGNTMVEGLHVTGFLLDVIAANCRYGDRIPYTCYQKLHSKVSNGSISNVGVYPTVEKAKHYKGETAWYAFHFLSDVLEGSELINSDIAGPSQQLLRIETFRKGDDFYVVFANRTPNTYTINRKGEAHYMYGEHPWSSNGETYWNGDDGKFDPVTLVEGSQTDEIPPYGFGYIKVKWADIR